MRVEDPSLSLGMTAVAFARATAAACVGYRHREGSRRREGLLASPIFCHPETSVIPSVARDLSPPTKKLRTMSKRYYVYVLTNWNNKVMYVGVTSDLARRLYEHMTKAADGFTAKYNVRKLVYFEKTSDVRSAIAREKQLKGWRREKKNALVRQHNPQWRDLGGDMGLCPSESAVTPSDSSVSPSDGTVVPSDGTVIPSESEGS